MRKLLRRYIPALVVTVSAIALVAFFQNCGNVNVSKNGEPEVLASEIPAPVAETPVVAPPVVVSPPLPPLTQPAANPITDQNTLPANLPVPPTWTRSVPIFSPPQNIPAAVKTACAAYANIQYLEMPWLPATVTGSAQQVGMVVTPSIANSVVVLHTFVPYTSGPFTIKGISVMDVTNYVRFRFAEAPWAQLYDRKSKASGTACDFAGVTADNTSDRIVGVQPNPAASTSPIFARGTDIYYSIETPQGDTNVLCAEHPTSFALRICDFIIQVAYGKSP